MKILKFIPLLLAVLVMVASCGKKKTRAEIEADFKNQSSSSSTSEEIYSGKDRTSNHEDNTEFNGNLKELQEKEEAAKKLAEENKKKAAEAQSSNTTSVVSAETSSETVIVPSTSTESNNNASTATSTQTQTATAPVTPPANTQQEQTVKVEPAKKDVIVDGQAQ